MSKSKPAEEIPLVPETDLKNALKSILSTTKKQSDKQLAKFQASNAAKREAKK